MKFVLSLTLCLSLLLSWAAQAQEAGGGASVLNLNLARKSVYVYPQKVLTAYFVGRNLGEITVKEDGTLEILVKGRTRIQVLNRDGSVTTLNIETFSSESTKKVSRSKDGYFFQYRYIFQERNYVDNNAPDVDFWSHQFLLETRVGAEDKFLARYNTQSTQRDTFFLRYDYEPRFYGAYGDSPFIFNDYRVNRLGLPLMRQGILGYDYKDIMVEAWSGEQSPYYFGKNQTVPEQDNMYGFRTNIGVTPTLDVFFSNATNPTDDISLNYIGFRKNFLKYHSLLGTIGGTEERPAWAWKYQYRHATDNWSLQNFSLTHDYAGEGLDSINSFSTTPYERIQMNADFFNPQKNHEGSIFFSPGARYTLDGYDQTYEGFARVGWKNRRVRLFNDFRHLERDYNLTASKTTADSYRPAITLYLLDEKEQRLGVTFSQMSQSTKNEPAGTEYDSESSDMTIEYNRGRLRSSTFVGRNTYDLSSGQEVAGYYYGGRLSWRQDSYMTQIGGKWQYLDQNFTGTDTGDYALARRILFASASAKLTKNHFLGLNYQNLRYTARDMDQFRLLYTFEFGDDKRSIPEMILPANVNASVFYDKNYNGIQEPGEETINGLTFELSTDRKSSLSKTGGEVSFSSVPRALYTLTVTAENWVLDKNYIPLDLQRNYSSQNIKIAAFPKRTVVISLKADPALVINSQITCNSKVIIATLKDGNTLVDLPSDSDCILNMDTNTASGSISFSDNSITLKDKNDVIVYKNKAISGYVFKDKNKNGVFDEGEGFSTTFDLGKYKVKSNKSGFFDLDPDSLDESMQFKKANCFMTPASNYFRDVFSQKRAILILCK